MTITPALFGGVAWVGSGVLTGWLALTQLGYASVLPALQGYALWNGIAAVITLFFAARLFTGPSRGALSASVAWGVISVFFCGVQVAGGATNELFIGSIVLAGAAGVLSFVARNDLVTEQKDGPPAP
jgi:hypothetical protein